MNYFSLLRKNTFCLFLMLWDTVQNRSLKKWQDFPAFSTLFLCFWIQIRYFAKTGKIKVKIHILSMSFLAFFFLFLSSLILCITGKIKNNLGNIKVKTQAFFLGFSSIIYLSFFFVIWYSAKTRKKNNGMLFRNWKIKQNQVNKVKIVVISFPFTFVSCF